MTADGRAEIIWQPANGTEAAMAAAITAGDLTRYFRLVESAELYLPASTSHQAGTGQTFVTREVLGVTYLLVYTSLATLVEQVRAVAGGFARVTCGALARDWPNPSWRLAINQGTPIEAHVRIEAIPDLARGNLSMPTFDEALAESLVDAGLAGLSPNEVDAALLDVVKAGDADGFVAVLMNALVRIPTTTEVAGPLDLDAADFPWRMVDGPQGPVIEVFTSGTSMVSTYPRPVPHVVVPLPSALAVWPERAGIAVNPDMPHRLVLPSGQAQLLLFWPTSPAIPPSGVEPTPN
jgi:hypothetical protein